MGKTPSVYVKNWGFRYQSQDALVWVRKSEIGERQARGKGAGGGRFKGRLPQQRDRGRLTAGGSSGSRGGSWVRGRRMVRRGGAGAEGGDDQRGQGELT